MVNAGCGGKRSMNVKECEVTGREIRGGGKKERKINFKSFQLL